MTSRSSAIRLSVAQVEIDRHLGIGGKEFRQQGRDVRQPEGHGRCQPVRTISPPAPVGFIRVKDRTLTPLAERFIECTRKIANSDSGRAPTRR
jgi:hypothetical protein